ncbi:MAG: MFS transporter [Candidatus Cloacimonetes bacterium]|nr:MFS transporter [Candidatus Cloacimonadota bacterium]
MLVFVSSIMMFFVGFEMGSFQSSVVAISTGFGLTSLGSGFLVAAQYAGIIIFPLLFGRVADKKGKKIVMLAFSAIFALGCILASIASSVATLIIGVFLIGSGYSVFESVSSAAMSEKYKGNGDRYINIAQAMLCIGAVISPILSGFIDSWRPLFASCAIGAAVSFAVLLASRIDSMKQQARPANLLDFSLFSRSHVFLMLFLAMLMYVGLENGIGYSADSLFTNVLGSATSSSKAISFYWAMMAVSRLASSSFSQKPFSELLVRFVSIALLSIGLSISRNPVISIVLCGAIGFAYGPIWSFLMNMAANQFPGEAGSAAGMMSSGIGLGGALFPILFGLLAQIWSIITVFYALAVISLIAFLIIWRTRSQAR